MTENGPTAVTRVVAELDAHSHRQRVNPRYDPVTSDDEWALPFPSPVAPMTPKSVASTCEVPRSWAYAATDAVALDLSIETGMQKETNQRH